VTDVADLIADMVRAGVDPELIGRTAAALAGRDPVKIVDEQAERRRAKDRERKRLRNSAESADSAALSSPSGSSPTPPSPNPHQSIPPSPPKGGSSPAEVDQVVSAFSAMAKRSGLSVPRAVTASRRRSLLLRIEEHGLPVVLDAVERIGRSRFCRGENDRGWRADLDFLCQPKSFVSILEGKYDDRSPHQSQAPPQKSAFRQHQDEIYQKLKRETGDRDDQFAGTTLDIGPGDYRPH